MGAVLDMPTADELEAARAATEAGDDLSLEPAADEDGTGQLKLSFSVGGKKPTSTSLRLTGGKIDVGEEFTKGETVRIVIEARVDEVAFIDQIDAKTGQVVGAERRHKAKVVGVSVDR